MMHLYIGILLGVICGYGIAVLMLSSSEEDIIDDYLLRKSKK